MQSVIATISAFSPFLSSHSSHQTQPLDLSSFGLQKRELSVIRLLKMLRSQTNQLVRILSSLEKAATPLNVIGTFRRAEIISSSDFEMQALAFQIERSKGDKI
jgi:hypothetical protein